MVESLYLFREPREYETFRWVLVTAFATGELPSVPQEARRWMNDKYWNSVNDNLFQALTYVVQGNLILCHEALEGTGKMTKENLKIARKTRSQVALCELSFAVSSAQRESTHLTLPKQLKTWL